MSVRIRKLPSGKYRVSTPGGVKARATTLVRAEAQARILKGLDTMAHKNMSELEIVAEAPYHDLKPAEYIRMAHEAIKDGVTIDEFAQDMPDYNTARRAYREVAGHRPHRNDTPHNPRNLKALQRARAAVARGESLEQFLRTAAVDEEPSYERAYRYASKEHRNPSAEVEEVRIPLDSLSAIAPPIYLLHYLIVRGNRRLRPVQKLQLFPGPGFEEISFKFWGFDSYDIHTAFNVRRDLDLLPQVVGINYGIIVVAHENQPSIRADYQHVFKQEIMLGMKGIYGNGPIFEFFDALEHLPKLPEDWQYIQFVG